MKKAKIEKIKLPGSKVSTAHRMREAARELIIEKVTKVYGPNTGYTSLIEPLLLEHLEITEEEVQERIKHPKKPGK
jgi:hypothetical protein